AFPTTGNRLRTETPNATGFIGDRQPGIGFRRGYGDAGMNNQHAISRLILKPRDLVSTADTQSPAPDRKERNIGSQTAKCFKQFLFRDLPMTELLQTQ